MSKYEVARPTDLDVLELARSMSLDDAREVWASNKLTPHRAVIWSVRRSSDLWVGRVDGRAVCMFGVSPLAQISNKGVIWMLSTEELKDHGLAFLRRNKDYIQKLSEEFVHLHNYVDVRNQTSINWLKWLGAKFSEPAPHGPFGLPFMKFEMVLNGTASSRQGQYRGSSENL